MPMKPTKRGIKVWCLADSNNRYIQAFDMYSGKGGHTDPAEDADVSGLGVKVVMLLTCTFKELSLSLSFVTIIFPQYSYSLHYINIYANGTVRQTSQSFPLELKITK